MNILELIDRDKQLFKEDISRCEAELCAIIKDSSFLILGGAGSIGQSVTKELFKRKPRKLHVIDISENNLVELVRDIRSSYGYIEGDFKTYALDIGSVEYDAFIQQEDTYDYVMNLSALKHVRSEKDQFTLMRMLKVNIFNTDKTLKQAIDNNTKKYFCVSTDKAANPVNMMGASKRIMEMFAMRRSAFLPISMARFANVAFSDGSLLHGFEQRLQKRQPLVAPSDIKRYFITPQESGELCLMSCIFGENRDIFFPKLKENLHLISFAEIAERYLNQRGLEVFICESEEEARRMARETRDNPKKWPCYFSTSDTTGEKSFEEFYTAQECLDMNKFENLGIIKNTVDVEEEALTYFEDQIQLLNKAGIWTKNDIVQLFNTLIPNFEHKETGRYLDSKM